MKKIGKKTAKALLGLCACAVAVSAAAAITLAATKKGPFTGVVTADNGAPLSDVLVSDGRNVTKTDADGSFKLRGWRKSSFVFITVPAGYATDRFYIPVEKKTESYDFQLQKDARTAEAAHCFLQISDTEIGAKGAGEWLGSLKTLIQTENPAFLIHTGDICYEDGLKKHIEEMNTATMGCPVRYVIGNHDYVDGKYGEALYESLYGPCWYSFEVGNIHYAVTSFQKGSDYASRYNEDDRWRWLENDLKHTDPAKKVVMFNHTKCPDDNFVLTFDRKQLDLKEKNLAAWFYGHYHYNYATVQNGILNVSTARPDCGGIDSSPAGTRVVRIDENQTITTDTVYYGSESNTPPQNMLWQQQLEGNALFCDTICEDDSVFIATADDDLPRTCGIYKLRTADGAIEWFYPTKNSVKNNLAADKEAVYAMDADGTFYRINKADGHADWIVDGALAPDVGTSSGICIRDGVLYGGNPRHIYALRTDTGEIKWQTDRARGENSPAEFTIAGDRLLVNSHWDALVALDPETGKELWKNNDSAIRFRSSTPVALDEKTLLVADSDSIMLLDSDSGEITAKITPEGYNFSSSGKPAVQGDVAYIPTANKGLIAFDTKSKEILWNFEPDDAKTYTPPYVGKGAKTVEASPVLYGNLLIVPASDGRIYTLDAKNGDVINYDTAGAAVLGKAAVTATRIYAAAFNGVVMCFSRQP